MRGTDSFKNLFGIRHFNWVFDREFEAIGREYAETDEFPGHDFPRLKFWVNISLNETKDTRPSNYGLVNLGFRRLPRHGQVWMAYHVQRTYCGGPDDGHDNEYKVGLEFDP